MSVSGAELARLRQAFAVLDASHEAPASCPAPERLWSGARGELGPQETRALVDHVAGCAGCAAAWRLALHLAGPDGVAGFDRPAVAGAAGRGRRVATVGALAAAAILAAVALVRPPAPRHEESTVREPSGRALRSLLAEDRPLPRQDFQLRWTPGPEGSLYEVWVASGELEDLAEATGLATPEYRVPPDALASVASGATVLWQVEAAAPDGTRLVSPTFVARLE